MPLFRCRANIDGECDWPACPQLIDGEPERSGRSCTLAEHVTTCRCGRPAYLGASDDVPRCPACEYLPCETCDCVPAWGR